MKNRQQPGEQKPEKTQLLAGISVSKAQALEETYATFDALFPQGLRADEEGLKLYREKTSDPLCFSDPKSLANALHRLNFASIDRGVFSSPLSIPQLSQEELDFCLSLIRQRGKISYGEILSQLSRSFNQPFANRYILKSALDPHLKEGFITGRDYVQIQGEKPRENQDLETIVATADRISVGELCQRNPGLNRRVLLARIYARKDLVSLGGDEFIALKALGLDAEDEKKILTAIGTQVEKHGFITVEELMPLLASLSSIAELKLNQSTASSLLSALLDGKYSVGANVIAPSSDGTRLTYLEIFIRGRERFTLSELRDFTSQLKARPIPTIDLIRSLKRRYIFDGSDTFISAHQLNLARAEKALTLRVQQAPFSSEDSIDLPHVSGITWTPFSILSLALSIPSIKAQITGRGDSTARYVLNERKR